jgi:nucleotide-binding universal stress UspA family protein
VLVALSGGSNDEAAAQAGLRLAENLKSTVEPSAVWVGSRPGDGNALAVAVEQSSRAAAAVIGVGPDWSDGDFGKATSALAEAAECPVYVVRSRLNEKGVESPASG